MPQIHVTSAELEQTLSMLGLHCWESAEEREAIAVITGLSKIIWCDGCSRAVYGAFSHTTVEPKRTVGWFCCVACRDKYENPRR